MSSHADALLGLAFLFVLGCFGLSIPVSIFYAVRLGWVQREAIRDLVTIGIGLSAIVLAPLLTLMAISGFSTEVGAAVAWILLVLCVIADRLRR